MLITVHRQTSPWDAHIVRGLLASQGIPATLLGEHFVALDWWSSLAIGQVQVQVPAACAESARAVLADRRSGELARQLQARWALPPDVCPVCRAWEWQPRRSRMFVLWLAALAWLTGLIVPLPPPSVGRRCGGCGHFEPLAARESPT